MNAPDLGREAGIALAKTIPPWVIWLSNPNNVLAVVSTVYVILQIAFLLRKELKRRGQG